MPTTTATLLAAEGPNGLWLPADINEVIWSSLAFLIVAVLLYKFGADVVRRYYANRTAAVEERLDAAASARTEAEAERDRIKAALADSDDEAARIIEEARQTADRLRVDIAARTETEIAQIRDRAAADLVVTQGQANADLAGEVSRLALGATEQYVGSTLDGAAQQRLIDDYIRQVGSQS